RRSSDLGCLLFLGLLGHERLGGQHQTRHAGGVLQSGTHPLDGIDDALGDQVTVLTRARVVAEVALTLAHLLHDDRALFAGVGDDLAQGLLDGATDDAHANALLIADLEAVERGLAPEQRDAAAGDDALFDCRTGGVQRVLDASLLLLPLGLGGGTDLDDGDAAHELGQALLELLAVVVAGGVLDLAADLGLTTLDLLLAARAVDDRGVVLVDLDALGLAEVTDGDVLELEAELLGDDLTTGEDGDVLEHLLAAIAEAGGLHGGAVQGATELVHHEGGERLALDVLGDDEQGLLLTGDRLEHRQKILHVGDLLLAQEDVGVLEGGLHALGIRHEVGAQVAAVELHALDDVQGRLGALRLFDGDDAFLADLLHRLAEELADGLVAVGAHGTDLRDLVGITGGLGELLQLLGQRLDG